MGFCYGMYAMKSWAFTHVKTELALDVSETISGPSVRGLGDERHALLCVYAHKYALGAQCRPLGGLQWLPDFAHCSPSVLCWDRTPYSVDMCRHDTHHIIPWWWGQNSIFTWLLTWEKLTVHSTVKASYHASTCQLRNPQNVSELRW
jgi:hypothetical protein